MLLLIIVYFNKKTFYNKNYGQIIIPRSTVNIVNTQRVDTIAITFWLFLNSKFLRLFFAIILLLHSQCQHFRFIDFLWLVEVLYAKHLLLSRPNQRHHPPVGGRRTKSRFTQISIAYKQCNQIYGFNATSTIDPRRSVVSNNEGSI